MRKLTTPAELGYRVLKNKHRLVRERPDFPKATSFRIHRALSWVARAEKESDDPDAAFLFYWIAFNAAYAESAKHYDPLSERSCFKEFFGRVLSRDQTRILYGALWQKYSGAIRSLLKNQYVYQLFWKFQKGTAGFDNWEERFHRSNEKALSALKGGNPHQFLCVLFDRLYVLRNQLVHGGATWNSKVNRRQVRDGYRILSLMVPRFIDLMLEHPEMAWGEPMFPVIEPS